MPPPPSPMPPSLSAPPSPMLPPSLQPYINCAAFPAFKTQRNLPILPPSPPSSLFAPPTALREHGADDDNDLDASEQASEGSIMSLDELSDEASSDSDEQQEDASSASSGNSAADAQEHDEDETRQARATAVLSLSRAHAVSLLTYIHMGGWPRPLGYTHSDTLIWQH
jgi:hypothetical protein